MTLSFWAKAAAGITYTPIIIQDFGSGGSGTVTTNASSSITLTTSWARYSVNFTVPSISGKTIGTSSCLVVFPIIISADATIDIWGVQAEAGSTATAFQTATGTIQGELAACQRYLPALSVAGNDVITGQAYSTTQVDVGYVFPVQPRVKPTGITVSSASSFYVRNSTAGFVICTSVVFQSGGPTSGSLIATVASGLTAGNASMFFGNSPGLILWTGCEL
jgi:hypothetical protein